MASFGLLISLSGSSAAQGIGSGSRCLGTNCAQAALATGLGEKLQKTATVCARHGLLPGCKSSVTTPTICFKLDLLRLGGSAHGARRAPHRPGNYCTLR